MQDRLGLIVGRMGDRNPAGAPFLCDRLQKPVPNVPCRLLDAFSGCDRPGGDVDLVGHDRDSESFGELVDPGGVLGREGAAQTVVEMGGDEPEPM